jgi:hypothetical protein
VVNFKIQELVPKKIYTDYGYDSWRFIDIEIVKSAQCIRDYFGVSVICNSWLWGGSTHFRGYRPEWCTIGSKFSLHRYGRALDLDVVGVDPDIVRQAIRKHWKAWGIARIETDIGWVHIDKFFMPNQEKLIEFVP